jgi:hypothetical protein
MNLKIIYEVPWRKEKLIIELQVTTIHTMLLLQCKGHFLSVVQVNFAFFLAHANSNISLA